jgi:phosphoglycolate phosphatase-like HAD superfamily hydrolase
MKALLFDIDGTLVNSHGLGRKAFESAIDEALKIPADLSEIDWFGRTDYDILTKFFELKGIKDHIDKKIQKVFTLFVKRFEDFARQNPAGFTLLPGVKFLLESLKGSCLGLVTGNVMEAAYIKLKMAGIEEYFPFGIGGFGNEAGDRCKLLPIAIDRMKEYYKVGEFNKVYIIGDSPRDIECAHTNGALCLAVATGKMKSAELGTYRPDYLFEDFNNIQAVTAVLK